MPEKFRGPWIKPNNEKEVDCTTKEENSKKGRRKKKIVDKLVVTNTEEANAVKDQLTKVGKIHFPTSKNRDCMFAAYLANLNVQRLRCS